MNGLKWEKLTTGVFWGGNGGPWWRGLHEQQVFYLYKPVLLKHDGLILKALKICIGNQAGALSLRSPFHVTLSSPPPISQSTKPGKSISLPLIRKCGTSCSQHDYVTGMEERHEKEFQQKQLAWELADLLLAWDTIICVTSAGSWLILNKKKMFHKGKRNLRKHSCSGGPKEKEQSCVERTDKD